jgi:hypothetical protein
MKTSQFGTFVIFVALFLTACNGGGDASGASTGTTTGPSEKTLVQTNGCSATANGAGGIIQCSDGSSAQINNGAAGAQGPQGPAGAAGATGSTGAPGGSALNVYASGGSGIKLGTSLLSVVYVSAGNTGAQVTVNNSGDGAIATYNLATGGLLTQPIYYTSTNCTGTGWVTNVVVNTVFAIGTTEYMAKGTTTTITASGSVEAANGSGCSPTTFSNMYVTEVASYNGGSGTSGEIPASATLPFAIK